MTTGQKLYIELFKASKQGYFTMAEAREYLEKHRIDLNTFYKFCKVSIPANQYLKGKKSGTKRIPLYPVFLEQGKIFLEKKKNIRKVK